jgi:hypothetical protein
MKIKIACVLLACLTLVGVACRWSGGQVRGSGNRKTESRDVTGFNEVVVNGAYRVEIEGSEPRSLEIEADDNILPLIKTEVVDGRLQIGNDRSYNTQSLPVVRIGMSDLRMLSLPGAGDIRLSGVSNDSLKITVDGAGKLSASGETENLDVTLNGAGMLDARELRAQSATVVSNGAGMSSVYASESLNATVNGVGGIDFYGHPKIVNQKVNGIGQINKK